jgi:hypothetical protein
MDVADPFWVALLAKMLTSAAIVVAASLIAERGGPFIGAMIATLPVSAGPSYLFLAIEHGAEFIAHSSLVSLAMNAVTGLFSIAYAVLARRHGLAISIVGAFAAWGMAAWIVFSIQWTLPLALLANAVVYALGIPLTRRLREVPPARRIIRRWWDIPSRALAVMVLVAVVIACGRALGPDATGIAAVAPLALTCMVLILHPRLGGPAAAAILIHSLPGLLGFGVAILILNRTVVPLGITLSLLLALATCLAWNAGLMLLRVRGQRLRAAPVAARGTRS